ncbi:MAG: bacillithiol biosynthesis deacetylase BshB1 [Ignavibacteriae bacterium]|nr:bacillithiol biosynthesis deacetylase BshB1 [Ignavibacteriota bacterium]
MAVDVLAIGPHPDDIEISCGGTVASLVKQGYRVALADLTRGEMGTRGTKEIRQKEAERAAKILGIKTRYNLEIPDGGIELNKTNLHKVISLIRELQPKILFIPHSIERHPDHVHGHNLCKEAWFYSGLTKLETKKNGKSQTAYRPDRYFEYLQWHHFVPTFIVDISDTFEIKMDAIKAHESQFHNPKSKEPVTRLTRPDFFDHVETDDKFYGQRIGVKYGEPFYSVAPIGIKNPFDLLADRK